MRFTRYSVFLMLLLLLLTVQPAMAQVGDIVVTTGADEDGTNSDACSLREAITATNTDAAYGGCLAGSGQDTISLNNDTYTLTLDTIVITDDLILEGNQSTIDAQSNGRILIVREADVQISDLSIVNGFATDGGGVSNEGRLVLNRVNFIDNEATETGGAILNLADLIIANSMFFGNTAAVGGAILNNGGLLVVSSTFESNAATEAGGALYTVSRAEIGLSTFYDNQSVQGGAVVSNSGAVDIVSSTFVGNIAQEGGALYQEGGRDLAQIGASLLYGNQGEGGSADCGGDIRVQAIGSNIVETEACGFEVTEDFRIGPEPSDDMDDTLLNNGGFTETLALRNTEDNPAVDVDLCPEIMIDIDRDGEVDVSGDQRGFVRPVDVPGIGFDGGDVGFCDLGSFELNSQDIGDASPVPAPEPTATLAPESTATEVLPTSDATQAEPTPTQADTDDQFEDNEDSPESGPSLPTWAIVLGVVLVLVVGLGASLLQTRRVSS